MTSNGSREFGSKFAVRPLSNAARRACCPCITEKSVTVTQDERCCSANVATYAPFPVSVVRLLQWFNVEVVVQRHKPCYVQYFSRGR